MSRAPILVVIAVATLVVAAIYMPDLPRESTPAPTEELIAVQFTLADERYTLLVPKEAEARLPTAQSPDLSVLPAPRGRMVRFLNLTASVGGADDARYDSSMRFRNGATLRYRIEEDVGGGSGGQEAELNGQLQIEGRTLAVTCHDQGEWSRHADWCLAYLHHLKVDGAPQ